MYVPSTSQTPPLGVNVLVHVVVKFGAPNDCETLTDKLVAEIAPLLVKVNL